MVKLALPTIGVFAMQWQSSFFVFPYGPSRIFPDVEVCGGAQLPLMRAVSKLSGHFVHL